VKSEPVKPAGEEEEDGTPQVNMQRIFALRNEIQTSRRDFEQHFRQQKTKIKSGIKKLKADMTEDEQKTNASSFQEQRKELENGMRKMSEVLKKDSQETQELAEQTRILLGRVDEVRAKVEAGVAELRLSIEQEKKMRRELLEQKNILSEDISELKALLATMQESLEDDESCHEGELLRLGHEGVQEANHLQTELAGIVKHELKTEIQKVKNDIENTCKLMEEGSAAIEQKENDAAALKEMRVALLAKLEIAGDDSEIVKAELAHVDEKIEMVRNSHEAIMHCISTYDKKLAAAAARLEELERSKKASDDPLVCATPRESARMHGALLGATHHSTAVCMHPETAEACTALASSSTHRYDGQLDSEKLGLDLAAQPSAVPDDVSAPSALSLPPLPAPTAAWADRRSAAHAAALRPTQITPQRAVSKDFVSPAPVQDKLEDAKCSLETMHGLQQEMEEWRDTLLRKITKMEAAAEDEEDIDTMRNELETVEEKLAIHVSDVQKLSDTISSYQSEVTV